MKYIKTFEAYQTYSDYKKTSMKFGSPEDMKKDAILTMKRYLPTPDEKWIDSIEDQSVDDKGIKFELKIGRDTIHMYKVGKWSMQWEFYFNKKKMDPYDISSALENKHLDKFEAFIKYAMSFDFYADYIDDGGQYDRAHSNNNSILKRYKELSSSDQAKAKRELYKKFDKQRVDLYFN